MKNLFLLIALLISHSIQSQNIDITDNQKKRIDSIFTAEKIISISKGLSNEKIQDSVKKVRDNQIKELQKKVTLLKKEHTQTLIEIAKHNTIAKETSTEVDEVSDEQLKKERFKWAGIHLYSGVEIPKFEFNNINFNTELRYEFEKFEIGIKGDYTLVPLIDKSEYQFDYYLKMSFKIF